VSLPAGHRLGPYEVVAPVGAGGMGEVYRARDVRLGRTVAVKILPPELGADERYRHRFEREARAASALSHPHIAHLYDVGEQDGTHFIAMEYVEGENLRALVSRGPLEADRIVDIGLQMASALDEAHAAGIVHRDIKSANAVVSAKGQVKVLDFGLARQTRDAAGVDSQLSTDAQTQAGVVMGTVPYMSPEQALGKDVDARTDLFSLGVVLYELATGQLPFAGDTATQTIDQICHATPVPLATSNRGVPEELERIVRKCLEKDRDRRYATAGDLVVDLRNLQRARDSGAVATPKPSAAGRRRTLALVGLALLLGALAAGAAFLWRARGVPGAIDSIAVLPFRNESADPEVEYLSDGITESLINALAKSPDLKVISRTSAFAFKGSQEAIREIGRKLSVRALVVGRLVQRGDRLAISAELVDVADERQLWGGRYDRSVADLLEIEQELTQTIADRLRLQLSGDEVKRLGERGTRNPEAYQLYLKGRHFSEGTADEMDKGLEAFQQAARLDPDYALAHAAIAEAYMLRVLHGTSNPEEARRAVRAALDRAVAIDPELPDAHIVAGNVRLLFDWDWAGAEAEFRRAMEAAPASSLAQMEYAWCLWSAGRYDEALVHSKKALDLDPLSRGPMHHVGFTYLGARRYPEAVASFRKTLEVYPEWIWGWVKMGIAYAYGGRSGEALEAAEHAEALIAQGGETPLLRAWLGVLYARAGRVNRAHAALVRLAEIGKLQSVDPTDVASVYAAMGENEKAIEWLEKGYDQHAPNMSFVATLVFFDGLRQDPRFLRLMERLGPPWSTLKIG